jgi:hypothetical protein
MHPLSRQAGCKRSIVDRFRERRWTCHVTGTDRYGRSLASCEVGGENIGYPDYRVGDEAITWYIGNVSKLEQGNDVVLVLLEDAPFGDGSLLLQHPEVAAVSTRAFLRTLQNYGIIKSADELVRRVEENSAGERKMSRYMADRPGRLSQNVRSECKSPLSTDEDGAGGGASGGPPLSCRFHTIIRIAKTSNSGWFAAAGRYRLCATHTSMTQTKKPRAASALGFGQARSSHLGTGEAEILKPWFSVPPAFRRTPKQFCLARPRRRKHPRRTVPSRATSAAAASAYIISKADGGTPRSIWTRARGKGGFARCRRLKPQAAVLRKTSVNVFGRGDARRCAPASP